MGQLGPLRSNRNLSLSAIIYSSGVLVSSTTFGILLFKMGSTMSDRGRSSLPERLWILTLAASLLLVVDLVRMLMGRPSFSMGVHRQTPYVWRRYGKMGVLGWGLDTGLPFSTIRSTAMPLLACILLALGFGTNWSGLVYGAGVTLGVIAGLRLRSLERDPTGYRLAQRILVDRGTAVTRRYGILVPTGVVLSVGVGHLIALV